MFRFARPALNLPSSGPAFGGPLKSNVRPRLKTRSRGRRHRTPNCTRCRARRYLPQALHHKGALPNPLGSFAIVGQAGCPSFAESARGAGSKARNGRHVPWRCVRLGTKPRFSRAQAAAVLRIRTTQSARSNQASVTRLALPGLVCFAIQMKTQIHSMAAAHRARPNPSFKRTRLRRSA